MSHRIDVKQLTADSGKGLTYLNVICNGGTIGVWGSTYKTHTYFCVIDGQFYLMQFEDEAWAAEFFEKYKFSTVILVSHDYGTPPAGVLVSPLTQNDMSDKVREIAELKAEIQSLKIKLSD